MYSVNPNSWGEWGVDKEAERAAAANSDVPENFGNGGLGFGSDYGQGVEDFTRAYEDRRAQLEQSARPLGALTAHQVEVG